MPCQGVKNDSGLSLLWAHPSMKRPAMSQPVTATVTRSSRAERWGAGEDAVVGPEERWRSTCAIPKTYGSAAGDGVRPPVVARNVASHGATHQDRGHGRA